MRGKPTRDNCRIYLTRITPADAGKTVFTPAATWASRDHPRGCGENLVFAPLPLRSVGSPPRMRGKLYCPPQAVRWTGITPADAGKTCRHPVLPLSAWDHPRGCGENWRRRCRRMVSLGSPPRMRGKRKGRFDLIPLDGITPADAGKTKTPCDIGCRYRDHPRGCGEN